MDGLLRGRGRDDGLRAAKTRHLYSKSRPAHHWKRRPRELDRVDDATHHPALEVDMKPEILALLTAAAWGLGGYFEKKGLHLGGLPPQVGITVRTAVALVILATVSAPQLRTLAHAGSRSLAYLVLGGGVVAGAAGMLCFYAALKGAPLTRVMPIAFTSPLFGALLACTLGGEPLTVRTVVGTLLTISGIAVLTLSR
jgi:bacterial/archaeal transporter family protein